MNPPHIGPGARISAAQAHPGVKIALEASARVRWGPHLRGWIQALHPAQGEGMAAREVEQKGEKRAATQKDKNKRGAVKRKEA